jgi:hypothetical protein
MWSNVQSIVYYVEFYFIDGETQLRVNPGLDVEVSYQFNIMGVMLTTGMSFNKIYERLMPITS